MDTAAMLVTRQALTLVLDELDGVAAGCARLAARHRDTPMAARTLLQQAVPTTFGLKAAGWLLGVLGARTALAEIVERGLAAQLGGAAGTLAALGERGLEVLALFAREVDLPEPDAPWHTERLRIARIGAALEQAAGALEKIALDVVLLSQGEVGEVREPGGGSSTMPHKRNPVGSTIAGACARQVRAGASVLSGSLAQEHERAAGAWHAEWAALSGALALTGGAAAAMHGVIDGLEVDEGRMLANLLADGGSIAAERVAFALGPTLGRAEAHGIVGEAAARARASGRTFRDELAADARIGLDDAAVDRLLEPTGYLGSSGALVDRALARWQTAAGASP
jgi:3-carboxy-cis,cis-muconate cycloisomerase